MLLVKFGIGVQQSYLRYNQEFVCFFCQYRVSRKKYEVSGDGGGRGILHHGAVVTTKQLHLTQPEHRFITGSNPAYNVYRGLQW